MNFSLLQNKKITVSAVLILCTFLLLAIVYKNDLSVSEIPSEKTKEDLRAQQDKTDDSHPDVLNETFTIDGTTFTLKDGYAQVSDARDSVMQNTYTLYKKPIYGDIGNDSDADAAAIITLDAGGTGTFYYGVLVENMNGVYRATNGVFLGDRILPEYITLQGNQVSFTFLDRSQNEPMTAEPSLERTIHTTFDPSQGVLAEE